MSALFRWSDRYSVDVASIDGQHKQLIMMVNELNEARQAGHEAEVIGSILARLIDYTDKHFKHEEQLMRTHGYPGFAKHRQEHADLVRKVLDLQTKVEAGKAALTVEVILFLSSWLANHIRRSDKELGAFLSARQVA